MSKKEIHIEKYDIDAWEKEQKPYAMILTDVIQRIPPNRIREAFLWIYLESLPTTWVPNKQHLMDHFVISERTYERWMSWLNTVKLIEYRQNRNEGGSFGKGKLIVLNGSRFSPDAECNGTVKIGGTVVNKKKSKVIHSFDSNRDAKNGGTAKTYKTRSSTVESSVSPNRQKTEPRCDDGHINKTTKTNKVKRKTNKGTVFSCNETVKNHINQICANRKVFVEDEIIEQGIYYAYETNQDKSFDSINKRINIFLKKVSEGKWFIPQNYKGITSQSIKQKEDFYNKQKQEQYSQDAKIKRVISQAITNGGISKFREAFNLGMSGGHLANQGTMQKNPV